MNDNSLKFADIVSTPAERLKRLRKAMGISQRELARDFGVTSGAMTLWEKEARAVPGPVLKLIEAFEVQLGLRTEPGNDHSPTVLGAKFADEVMDTFGSGERARRSLARKPLKVVMTRYFSENLSPHPIKRTIQLAFARRLIQSFSESKGLAVKALQLASYLDFGLPEEVRDLLATLPTISHPLPATTVNRIFFEDFGKLPEQLFARWTPHPFATASIGQVHRATLRTGEEVAVKLQYPDILKTIDRQFSYLSILHHVSGLFTVKQTELFEELRERLRDECDYRLEAEHQRQFQRFFAGDPSIVVPEVFDDLCTQRILTTRFVDGISFAELLEQTDQPWRDRAGETIMRFHSEAIMHHGLMQGDPHPGNYLFTPTQVVFLDFGRVARISAEERKKQRVFHSAILHQQPGRACAAMRELGIVRDWKVFNFEQFWNVLLRQQVHHLTDGLFRFTPEYVQEIWAAAKTYPAQKHLNINKDFFWSICINTSLWSILGQLYAKADWRRNSLKVLSTADVDD